MAIDHLLLNNSKYYELVNSGQFIKLMNRRYAPWPESFVIPANTPVEGYYSGDTGNRIPYDFSAKLTGFNNGKWVYISLEDQKVHGEIDPTKIKSINWGGKTSLIRLAIKGLRHFTRRVAVAC